MGVGRKLYLSQMVNDAIAAIGPAAPPIPSEHASLLTPAQAAALIDHTLLKPDATTAQVHKLCVEAAEFGFASVCVHPSWVPLCAELLAGARPKVCTVVGFALGATLTAVKSFEAGAAIAAGAQELDMVIQIGRLKDADFVYVYDDIAAVVAVGRDTGVPVKTIIETALLTHEEKIAACVIARAAGAAFVKTSTGFSGGGATAEDIALMRQVVGSEIGVKAAGGVRTFADLLTMVAAGANRIGTSAGLQIVEGARAGRPEPVPGGEGASY